jgi:competence protein ComEA
MARRFDHSSADGITMTLRQAFGVLVAFAIVAMPAGAQATKAKADTKATKATTAAPAKAPAAAPDKAATAATLDINTATKEQLMAVKGIGDAYSAKIIAGRPYKSKDELWRKKILPKGVYDKVKDNLIAKQK